RPANSAWLSLIASPAAADRATEVPRPLECPSTGSSSTCENKALREPLPARVPDPMRKAICPGLLAGDREQLDVELERGVGWDRPHLLVAVGQGRRDGQPALAAHLHSRHALVPAGDDLAHPDAEAERLAAIVGAVELGAVEQRADVVHGDG